MKVNKPIPRLTQENLDGVIRNFTRKYDLGFTIDEINQLLRPNKLEEHMFKRGMYGSTYTKIENDYIYYFRDVYNILRELI